MRLIDLGVVYGLVGVGCAIAVARRAGEPLRGRVGDVLLSLLLWPLYVPVILAPPPPTKPPPGAADPAIERERALLVAAVEAVRDPAIASLLPSRVQLDRLATSLHELDREARELTAILSQGDFDPLRAEKHVKEASPDDPSAAENARLVQESIRRLESLRAKRTRERDELLALCRRLRMQVTVLRFSGVATEDVGGVVAEILGRIEGAGAAFGEPLEREGSERPRAA